MRDPRYEEQGARRTDRELVRRRGSLHHICVPSCSARVMFITRQPVASFISVGDPVAQLVEQRTFNP